MDNDFSGLTFSLEPPPDLFNRVMRRIEREKQLVVIKRKLIFSLFSFLGTLSIFIPVWKVFHSDIVQSGLGQYLIILFYDFQEVTKILGNYSFSILESLPALSLTVFLSVIVGIIYSLKTLVKYGQLLYKFSRLPR